MKRGYTLFWLIPLILAISFFPIITNSVIYRETVFLILMYITLAVSLNIILGYTGYVSFGHIVFYGIGGYTAFYLMNKMGIHLIPAMIMGGVLSSIIALIVGEAVLRLRGAIFAIATIGINEAVKSLVTNLPFLGGATGMFFNFKIYRTYGGASKAIWFAYYLMVVVTILSLITSYFIKNSKFGYGLFSIREDEDAAVVLGVNTKKFKNIAFAISAFFPGLVGAIFFFKAGNIEPEDAFHLVKSIEMIFMVMLGGFGTVSGPPIGALLYERLKGILLVNPLFKNLHMAIAGFILLIIVLFAPGGLVGSLRNRFKKLRSLLE
ncbi:branched-chain amino acid ABC transporter permease [Desulfothermus okinawensis JCM 13304]